jgi:hypothetical protein
LAARGAPIHEKAPLEPTTVELFVVVIDAHTRKPIDQFGVSHH